MKKKKVVKKTVKIKDKKAHEKNLRIIALTITPWAEGTQYWNADTQKLTEDVDAWIKGGAGGNLGPNDIIVDSYNLLNDPNKPGYLLPGLEKTGNSIDRLHFNATGHKIIAAQIAKQAFQ